MAQVTLQVPAAVVGPLRETVARLYEATAEALRFSLRKRGDEGGFDEVHGYRARLGQLEALLDELGWPSEGQPRAVELRAPADLLRDAVYGALLDAGERLASACDDPHGERGREVIRTTARHVIALDSLLRRVETPGQTN